MSRLLELLRGFRGDPLRLPLKGLVGVYAVGVVLLLLGALGVAEGLMTYGALLGIGAGLSLTVPTALAALFDWWQVRKDTPERTAAALHLGVTGLATALFALTFALQLDAYRDDEVTTGAWIVGLGALAVLASGGYVGRALVFRFRRTRGRSHTPVREALTARPEREEATESAARGGEGARRRRWSLRRRGAAPRDSVG